jgi:hypothetical protein
MGRAKNMIILKTVCDVPDEAGRKLFGRHVCSEPAIGIDGILISIMFGKTPFHVCEKHAGLPIVQLLKLVSHGEKKVAPIDDSQE